MYHICSTTTHKERCGKLCGLEAVWHELGLLCIPPALHLAIPVDSARVEVRGGHLLEGGVALVHLLACVHRWGDHDNTDDDGICNIVVCQRAKSTPGTQTIKAVVVIVQLLYGGTSSVLGLLVEVGRRCRTIFEKDNSGALCRHD